MSPITDNKTNANARIIFMTIVGEDIACLANIQAHGSALPKKVC